MASGQVLIDRADQGRRLHAGEEMTEEALLGALEGRTGGGLGLAVQRAGVAGHVGRLHRGVEIVVNDRERPGIGIVDSRLLGGELVLHQFVFDAVIGERARGVEAERAQIASQHLHRRNAAVFDRFHEFRPRSEGEILATP